MSRKGHSEMEQNHDKIDEIEKLAEESFSKGDYERAGRLYKEALEITGKSLRKNHPDYAAALNNLAEVYESISDYTKAEKLHKEALEIKGRALGKDHPSYAISLNNLAGIYYSTGDYEKAAKLLKEALEIKGRALGKDHPDYAASLNNLAEVYRLMGKCEKAEELYKGALEITRISLGKDNPNYATFLNNLANDYDSMGEYEKVEKLYEEDLKIIRKSLGNDPLIYATSLNNLASACDSMGDYEKAEKLHKEALEIFSRTLGKDHPDYATSLSNLARVYDSMGEYEKAEKLYKKTLEIRRRTLGKDHPDYAATLNNLASIYGFIGDYRKAEKLHKEDLEITRKLLGKDNPSYAISLNNLALVYESMGDYEKAAKLLKEALEIKGGTLGKDRSSYATSHATSLNNLGSLYDSIGDYKKAEKLHKESLEIRGRLLGEDHPDYATSLNNLGSLYYSMGDYEKAERLLKEAAEITGRSLGKGHPSYATSLNNLALVYDSIDDYKKAEKLLREALEIIGKSLGKDHSYYAASLRNLANVYDSVGDYKKAENLYKEALEIVGRSFGENHPDNSSTMSGLALVYYHTNRINEAFNSIKNAIEIDDETIRNVFSMANEKQKLAYIGTTQRRFDILLSIVLSHQSHDKIEFAFNTVLRRKGIVAEILAMQREQLLAKKNPQLRLKFKELSHVRNMTMLRYQAAKTSRDRVRTREKIEELYEKSESLERELSRRIPEYVVEKRIAASDVVAVSGLLRKGSVLVEFVRFYKSGIKSNMSDSKSLLGEGPRYSAFICRKDAPEKLEIINLSDAEVIDAAIAELKKAISMEGESEQDCDIVSVTGDSKTKLEQLILKKIEPSFEGCKEIILAPDGQLNLLPFEILRSSNGKMLIENYLVSYIGTGRDMLRVKRNIKKRHGSSKVIADPDFNLASDRKRKKETEETHYHRSREFERGKHIMDELPATNFEGNFIARLLAVRPIMRGDALEGEIRKIQSPKILHVATHGFFFEDNDWSGMKQKAGGMEFGGNIERLAAKLENSLLRSGLVLAGYNTYQRGGNLPLEAEDGALTAEDVSEMDLSGTELVVLSACGTGLGDVRAGEGVFGLRRTFVLAGAKTLVVSLWSVDDLATMLLMNRFYENLLKRKMPKAESLRDAQLYLRGLTGGEIAEIINSNKAMREHFDILTYDAHKDAKPFSNPRYWGAFICIGDPGPLT